MKFKSRLKRLALSVVILFGLYVIIYCWISFPVATGYGAKVLCSAIFISGRNEQDIKSQELNFTPLNLARYAVNYLDSSVTCSLLGFAKRKAVYRTGLGATLVNGLTEKQIREQKFRVAVIPPVKTDTIPWPFGDQLADSFPRNIDSSQIRQSVDNIFKETDKASFNRTRALIIVYNNHIIAERYAPGFNKDTRLTGWSMTKSIMGALTGVLIKQNKLKVDELASVPEWKTGNDPRHSITVRHLLQQTTGLEFQEVYYKSSHATRMLCQEGDMGAYAASLSLKHPPGSVFHYSSGNTNILSRIIRQTLGDDDYHAFPYEHLFYKLGMLNTLLEPDASGTFVGSSYCYATARDWARFGLLYMNKGVFNNEQILPGDWIQQSVTPSDAATEGEYGFQWWLNVGEKANPENRRYPHLPTDMFFADGFEGQNIFIIPSKKLLVVRLGLTRTSRWGEERFLQEVSAAIH
jgi:CubicO group peptidase (beta-lactamase class C family)